MRNPVQYKGGFGPTIGCRRQLVYITFSAMHIISSAKSSVPTSFQLPPVLRNSVLRSSLIYNTSSNFPLPRVLWLHETKMTAWQYRPKTQILTLLHGGSSPVRNKSAKGAEFSPWLSVSWCTTEEAPDSRGEGDCSPDTRGTGRGRAGERRRGKGRLCRRSQWEWRRPNRQSGGSGCEQHETRCL